MNGTCRHCSFSPCGSSGRRGPFGRRRPCVHRRPCARKGPYGHRRPCARRGPCGHRRPCSRCGFCAHRRNSAHRGPITIVLPVIVVVLVAHMSVELFVWVCVSKTTLHLPFQETQSLLFLHS